MIRRFLPIGLLAFWLVPAMVASADPPSGDNFAAAISPTAVQPLSTGLYTMSITNWVKSPDAANAAHVQVPDGFTVDAATLEASITAGACSGTSWTASLNASLPTTIDLAAPDASSALCPGATLTVAFTAAAPTAEQVSEWTTTVYRDSTQYSMQDAQPTVTVDGTPPPAPTITTSLPNVTASTSASFSLSDGEPAVAYLCRLDAAAFAPCPTVVSFASLGEGSHVFQAKVVDAAGNQSSVASFSWTIDLTNPVVTIAPASEPPKLTNHSSASFVFTSNKPNSTFACQLDGSAFSGCTSPASYSGLASGTHTFAVKATDSVGNVGLPTTWQWTVDTIPPKTTITRHPDATSSSASATFEFTTSEPISGSACSLDGGAFAACSSPRSYGGLADGQHTFRVRSTDLAGNAEASPAAYSWQVSTLLPPDTTPPAPVKNVKPRIAYGSLKLAWTLPGDFDLDHVQVVRTNEPSGTRAKSVYAGKGTGYADRRFQNGTWYRYAIRAYDQAGNASRRVTIDTKPSALLRRPTDGAAVRRAPLLLWTAGPKAHYYNVQLYRGGKKVLSSWPVRPRLQLKSRWRYQSYRFRLRKGTYRWYVWPAFGSATTPRFGQLLGTATFVVR